MHNRKERRAIAHGNGLLRVEHRYYMPWDVSPCFIQGEINASADRDIDSRYESMDYELYWFQWEWQVNRPLVEQDRVM